MQIPLVAAAVPTVIMKPSGNTVASVVLAGASVVGAGKGTVGLCGSMAYADGGLYCRENSVGACTTDLGDFPAKKKWSLQILWTDDKSIHLLKSSERDPHTYTQFKDKLYIDASPGALAPIGFTPDNSTLIEGETTWAWSGAYGFILWSPSDNPYDGLPDGGIVTGQGVEWVSVPGYPGLKQAYWNVRKFEETKRTGKDSGGSFGMCYGDYSATIIQGDSP